MTVEPLYRHVDGGDDWEEHAELDQHVDCWQDRADSMPDGVILVRDMGGDVSSFMVPDSRLQAISDAWDIPMRPTIQAVNKLAVRRQWPELAVLLDALTKDTQ